MTPERWQQVSRVYHEARARQPEERGPFLVATCLHDDALRREVESLLAREPEAVGFLTTPAVALDTDAMTEGRAFIGRQFGSYTVLARLGEGGMGEVYRARDTKLGRDVAIKILPPIFGVDPERLARFEREARLLAALNHPRIGAIYGVEDVDGVPALILELVEGDTLAQRAAMGSIPVHDALTIASQIAEALEAAHERGIVHRDLKPANIVLRDLSIKVLDFGLAKAVAGNTVGRDLSQSPAITGGGTMEGAILGTAAYMSPEQARGRPVDRRSDIWAFGCVLYEMLTGCMAFPGDTLTDTIAGILRGEPAWDALPATTPAGVRRLLRRCLEKDVSRRLRDIGDARLEIEEALTAALDSIDGLTSTAVQRWPTRAAWGLACVAMIAVVATLALPAFRGARAAYPNAVRFTVAPPLNIDVAGATPPAVSPDGHRFAFVAARGGARQLWVRSLDAHETQPVPGTEGAENAFWSPDNRTIAFEAEGKLKAADAESGLVRTLCDVPESVSGGSWSPAGDAFVFATPMHGLFSVAAGGGSPMPMPNPDAASTEARLFPTILPDGRYFIYLNSPSHVAWVGLLDGKAPPIRLLDADSQVQYVAPGFLVFVRRGTLMAQRFDARRRTLSGEAMQIAEGMLITLPDEKAFGTSSNGVLVYRTDSLNVVTQLTWADRAGRRLGIVGSAGRYRNPELSPNGSSVALEVSAPQSGSADLWRLELESGAMTRMTRDPATEMAPVWSPDGAWIVFGSNRDGRGFRLYRARADGTGGEEPLFRSSTAMVPQSWAPNDKFLLYQGRPAFKLGLLPLPPAAPHLFDDSPSTVEGFGQISPDGHWLTYASRERDGSDWDVYVQRFPTPGPDKTRVTANWGASPRWGRDGREIFYYSKDGRLMTVAVTSTGTTLTVGNAVPLFEAALLGGPEPILPFKQQYDVAKDGRFLLNVPVETTPVQSFSVVVNWPAALKR